MLDGNGSIRGNLVENAGDTAIQHYLQYLPPSYGNRTGEIYNNVVIAPGRVGLLAGNGIATGNTGDAASPVSRVYNNTIVGATATGILIGGSAASGFVRDNLIADAADAAFTAPPSVSKVNNRVGAASQMGFVALRRRTTDCSRPARPGTLEVLRIPRLISTAYRVPRTACPIREPSSSMPGSPRSRILRKI